MLNCKAEFKMLEDNDIIEMCWNFKLENQIKKDKYNFKSFSEYHIMWVDFEIAHFYGLHFVYGFLF